MIAILQLNAQETDPKVWAALPLETGETLFMDTNDNTLLAGETLYFKLFCLNPDDSTQSRISKIAYVEIIGSDLKTVVRKKLAIENSTASSEFFIPVSTPSGRYKIIAYTKRMLDFSAENFFSANIAIINPFQTYTGKISTNPIISEPEKSNYASAIQPDKNVYAQREKAMLSINPDGKLPRGNYSISVRRSSALSQPESYATSIKPLAYKVQTDALPELRGEMVSGKITSTNGKKISGKKISLSIPGKSFGFKIVQTDLNGSFNFILDHAPQSPNIVLQVMEPDRNDYTIIADTARQPDLSNLQFETLTLSPELKEEIEKRSIAIQVENAYYENKKDTVSPLPENAPFFHSLEKTYVLDDYARFPTLKETIIEVLKELYFTTEQDHYTLHIRNTTMDNEVYGLPLIMVDGLLIQDVDELFSYPAKYIEKVSLINEPYVYGPKTFGGVINFTTKLEDFKSNASGGYIKKLVLERPTHKKIDLNDHYENVGSRIPDYRYQLLWTETSGESQNIPFYTSDITGKFEITLEGFTENGIPVWAFQTIEVK